MDEEELAMAMAASSECSSGCQSGWTTYLDDHTSSYSCGTAARFSGGNGKAAARPPYYCCEYSEEDDLSMISDASSGPRPGGGNDAAAAVRANAERRGRREETPAAAAARRQTKRAAAASSLLEDTASSPAFFGGYSKESNGYGRADAQMAEVGNAAADFSYAFSTTTGFESSSPLNGAALSGYVQMHYSPAPVKPMPRRQVCRDASEKKRW